MLSLRVWSLCSPTREATIVRGPRTAMKSGPHLPQLEKALAQKRRPNTAINKNKKQKKQKIELPYDPAIPLLGKYPEKTIIQKEACTTMFIAALFTIARTWKQPKCPLTDEWIKKMWHIYTMEY